MKTKKDNDKNKVPQGGAHPDADWLSEKDREYQVKLIPITEISTEGQLVRDEMNDDHVIELSGSIARHGLLEPIVVRQQSDGYQLIAGAHRLAACKRLAWDLIPANIMPISNEVPVKSLALVENIVRKDLTLKEECEAINHLITDDKLSTSQICDLVGRTRSWVEKRMMALNLTEDIKTALFDNMIPLNVAELLSEVTNEAIRAQILQQTIYQKLPSYTVRELVQLYKDAPLMEDAIQAGIETKRQISQATEPERHCDACHLKTKYSQLKAMFVCIDADGCMDRVLKTTQQENAEVK